MKIKLAIAVLASFFFGALMLFQLNVVNAEVSGSPITGPITRPIETPTPTIPTPTPTKPVTNPITYFAYKVSGKVTYRYPGWFLKRLFIKGPDQKPAKNVKIEALNTKTKEKVYAFTDSNGNYTLSLKKGLYVIKPIDYIRTTYVPAYRYINITKNMANLSFIGWPKIWIP